ncbi:arylsulfatase B-like [Centruroides sculpturatus]|uniref:arylsulfatase B-like n=1 Tax=Centruroides sculpturatus TaxID=218467 RepID=UPI000C6CAA28|nr:arylsulfatase B-like [Centruroides sculpturatus]
MVFKTEWNICIVLLGHLSYIQGKPPHIIFYCADDLGWNDVSFHGSLQIPTPNIDVLAANSIVLDNYYTQHICTPSRAALLTGKLPIDTGLQHFVLQGAQPAGLPTDVKILPQYLKDCGYKTHGVGKWHLGFFKKEYFPTERGFDSFFGFWTGLMDYYDYTTYESYENSTLKYAWGDALRDNERVAREYKGIYATHLFTDRAINIIKTHDKEKPLFLYLTPNAVHSGNPYDLFPAPQSEVSKFSCIEDTQRRKFAAIVSEFDKSVGRIFKALQDNSMLDNTIFVLSTDNGAEGAGFRGGVGSNWPLRGNKGTLWEGGVRGVGIVWSKSFKQQPRIERNLMHITDWLPTLYHAAGCNVKDLKDIYGINQWETLVHGKPTSRKEILHNIDPIDGASALRFQNYKLVNGSNLDGKYNAWYGPTGRDKNYFSSCYKKLLRSSYSWKVLEKEGLLYNTDTFFVGLQDSCFSYQKRNNSNCDPNLAPCLFDILEDPCELENIANLQPKVVEYMLKRLNFWKKSEVPPVNQTIDPNADPALHGFTWTNWADTKSYNNYDFE